MKKEFRTRLKSLMPKPVEKKKKKKYTGRHALMVRVDQTTYKTIKKDAAKYKLSISRYLRELIDEVYK